MDWPIVPHGIAVALSGPSVFAFTAPSSPDRHREAAAIFNTYQPDEIQDDRVSDADIGNLLHDRIARFLVGLGLPRGLQAIGYKNEKCAGHPETGTDGAASRSWSRARSRSAVCSISRRA